MKKNNLKYKLEIFFKILDYHGFSDLTANHASALCEDKKHFYINQHQHLFSQVKSSNLVKVKLNEPKISKLKKVNIAGYNIHNYLHQSIAKPNFILHTHSVYGVAIASLKKGFVTNLNQSSMRFYNKVVYIEYGSMASVKNEGKKIANAVKKDTKLIILKNHGVVILGDTIEELQHLTFHFEKCAKIQILAMSSGSKLALVNKKISKKTSKQHLSFGPVGLSSWNALLRQIKIK